MLLDRLHDIIERRQLTALFQPIIHMQTGEYIGYEGLIRGPSDSPLHCPQTLFKVARSASLTVEVEYLCLQIVVERFVELKLPGKLFLNISPECLLIPESKHGQTLGLIHHTGINPNRIIIELTESQPTFDYELLLKAVTHYRKLGFQIAIDDLGEGFSSLRLWSELRPEYIKIDMHFIQGINQDPVKLQFVSSIQEIAKKSGSFVIAEGIESKDELLLLRDVGVAFGQGYHLARPHAHPTTQVPASISTELHRNNVAIYPKDNTHSSGKSQTAGRLLRTVPIVSPEMPNNHVYQLFVNDPDLQIVPVVENDMPIGVITRAELIDRFARPYLRELYGKKSCTSFMDAHPMITDKNTSLQELSQTIVDADRHHLFNGFIITDQGRYLGMGTGHDLMREITQMQINAARHANPLTLLPGNVPLNEHIERLLENNIAFVACYADLDNFKPYNDVYGYRKGDDVIQLTGRVLSAAATDLDFVGHIGGDDFIVLFQSEDWEARCKGILEAFAEGISTHINDIDRARNGYMSEDRRGNQTFHPLVALSLGIVKVAPNQYTTHHQIATAAAEAKKQSKKIEGNSMFIEPRRKNQMDDDTLPESIPILVTSLTSRQVA